jgi:hypothetical protein
MLLLFLTAQGRERWIRPAIFALPLVPVAVFVATLNSMWYGAPSNSGYGTPGELYQLANVWPNVKLYLAWLWQSQSPWMLLALVPFLPPFRSHIKQNVLAACALIAAVTLGSYLTYFQFDVWWYLRFLMPAFGAFAVMIAAGLVSIARALPQPFGRIAAVAMLYVMMATTISFAADHGCFGRMRASERRYVDVGEFAGEHLPTNAILFSTQHSGSLRFYSGRLTLRFDWVQPEWASGVTAAVERAGYHPYLIVDDWEIEQVRKQFGFAPGAPLPWPIVARMRELGGLTVFDMATSPGDVSPVALEPGSRHWCAPRRGPI